MLSRAKCYIWFEPMKHFTLILLLVFAGGISYAQSDQQLSKKYQQKLSKIKDEDKRAKKYKKYWEKDSLEQQKALRKAKRYVQNTLQDSLGQILPGPGALSSVITEELDSANLGQVRGTARGAVEDSIRNRVNMPGIALDSTLADQAKVETEKQAKNRLQDEVGVELPSVRLDSTFTDQALDRAQGVSNERLKDEIGMELPGIQLDSTLSGQVKDNAKAIPGTMIEDETGMDISGIGLDSAGRANISQQVEQKAGEMLKNTEGFEGMGDKGELNKIDEYKGQLEKTQQEMQQAMAKQELKEKMASQAREYISQHADKIQQVQSKMGELKKKYSYVPNSNDLSTAKKRSSLEDEPLGKRLVFGGNFNVTQTNPVNIDLAPVVGYRINKLFEIGVTGIYRAQFEESNRQISAYGDDTYGYGVFVNHMVFKNFFGHLEGENISRNRQEMDQTTRVWDQALLAGIGRRFKISKWLEMQAIITYNFLHDNQDGVYNNPVVFKTGVRVRN